VGYDKTPLASDLGNGECQDGKIYRIHGASLSPDKDRSKHDNGKRKDERERIYGRNLLVVKLRNRDAMSREELLHHLRAHSPLL